MGFLSNKKVRYDLVTRESFEKFLLNLTLMKFSDFVEVFIINIWCRNTIYMNDCLLLAGNHSLGGGEKCQSINFTRSSNENKFVHENYLLQFPGYRNVFDFRHLCSYLHSRSAEESLKVITGLIQYAWLKLKRMTFYHYAALKMRFFRTIFGI